MRVLFIQNIPSPYRIDFFNELGKYVDLTVVFEAKTTPFTVFNYNLDDIKNFTAHFVREGDIREKRVDWGILRYIRRGAYDCVVATNYAYFTEAAAILALKARRIPFDLELDGGIVRSENPLVRAGKRFLMKGARTYFSTSAGTDAFLRFYCGDGLTIRRYPFTSLFAGEVLSAPPSQREKRALRSALGIEAEQMILSVGKFTHRKGFDVLMDAASALSREVAVCIVGGEARPEYLAQRERLRLSNVRFLPFMKKEELNRYYRAADLFAFPTREDVWGLVVNEAMANGLPVITTDKCVAGQEMVREGENGFLIPIEDPAALRSRVEQLLGDAALRGRMADSALETARAYTFESMARAHVEAWEADGIGKA